MDVHAFFLRERFGNLGDARQSVTFFPDKSRRRIQTMCVMAFQVVYEYFARNFFNY
jgi:hypothetical protein